MKEKLIEVKIADIIIGSRQRQIDEDDIIGLAESIMDVSLLNPIILREGNTLVAGMRRLAACKYLEWETIPCRVFPFDGPDAELAEIDENLERQKLTALELGQHLKRRKELYQEKHPETRRGGAPGKKDGRGGKVPRGKSTETVVLPFADDAAKKIGKSRVTVYESIQLADRIDAEVQEEIKGTPIDDSKSELKKLAKLPLVKQKKVAKDLKAGKITKVPTLASKPRKPKLSKPPKIDQTPTEFNAIIELFAVQHKKYVKNFLKTLSEHPGGKVHPSPKKAVVGQVAILTTLITNLRNRI